MVKQIYKKTVAFSFALGMWSAFQGTTATPAVYSIDPVVSAITKLQPALKPAKAKKLAEALVKARCTIPWQILVSIAYHESSLRMDAHNASTNDHGLMQINSKNFLRYGLAHDRLVKDAGYSIQAACRILEENRERYAGRVPYWIGLYRSGTALWKENIRDSAMRYDRIIRRTASTLGYVEGPIALYAQDNHR